MTQQGVGTTPGYAAIDVRRADGAALSQGIIGASSYFVSQRGAGANMSVDIAASSGSLAVSGGTITAQGLYIVPSHSAVINEAIAAADATNPRIDQVIAQVSDNAIDSTGQNRAQTVVLTGTPTAGATLANRNGAAALPASAIRLADVLVPAASASVTNANIKDRRPKTRGKTNIATSESRTNVAYGTLTTPDQVTEIVLPTDGVICVLAHGTFQTSVGGAGKAAIFLGANQVVMAQGSTAPGTTSTEAAASGTSAIDTVFGTTPQGMQGSGSTTSYTGGDVTTGQVVGVINGTSLLGGGVCCLFAAAGTYDVSVQFKASSGSITAKNRHLWVWTMSLDAAVVF